MDFDLNLLAKLFARFYTETGKNVCLELVKKYWVNPQVILGFPNAVLGIAEPIGNNAQKGKAMAVMFRDLAQGTISKEAGERLLEKAKAEAKPSLFVRDYTLLMKAHERSRQYRLQHINPEIEVSK